MKPPRHRSRQTDITLVVAIVYNASWLARTASAAEVVRTEMSPFLGRVTIEGPTVMLSAKVAQNFAPAVHELATNAAKYGALSNATGRVRIHWSVFKPNGHRLFVFRWQEQGGPPVTQPKQKGFGSAFLERVMAEYFETPPTIEFAATGVRYELSGSLDEMTTEKGIVERT